MINFSDPQTRYLIDYANLKQGLIKHQNDFLSKKEFFFDKIDIVDKNRLSNYFKNKRN